MSDDSHELANANEPDEPEDAEPLSETAAKLYLSMLMEVAASLRREGALAADAVRQAEKAMRERFPKAPKLSDLVIGKLALTIIKIKKPVDPKAAMILAANPKEARPITNLGDLLKSVIGDK